MSQLSAPFVLKGLTVPSVIERAEFRLRTLTVHDVVKAYDAVMSSVQHLKMSP